MLEFEIEGNEEEIRTFGDLEPGMVFQLSGYTKIDDAYYLKLEKRAIVLYDPKDYACPPRDACVASDLTVVRRDAVMKIFR